MHNFNWDDLRIAHCVASTGSLSGAAEVLGVAHTTVLRRITAFEAETGAQLFERTNRGYVVNHDRLKAFEAIARAGRAIEEARHEISKASIAPGEALRLTSTDAFCVYVLPEVVAGIRRSEPGLNIALMSFNTRLNLAHGHVDLTVRPTLELPDDLVGKIAAHLAFGVYTGVAGTKEWLGVAGPIARSVAGQWLETQNHDVVARADSFLVVREMIARNLGQCILPCFLGDDDPRLVKVPGPMDEIATPIWVAGHRDLADTGQLHRLRRRLVEGLREMEPRLMGAPS